MDDLAGDRDGPRRSRSTAQASYEPGGVSRSTELAAADGDLEEHAVAVGDGPAQAQPRAAPPDRPGPPGAPRRARRRTRGRRPPDPAAAAQAQGSRCRPSDPDAEWPARVEGADSARARRTRAPHPRGARMALRPLRAAAADSSATATSRWAPGEVAEFDTSLPHWFGPAGDHPVEILSLLGRHADHAHVRADPHGTASGA